LEDHESDAVPPLIGVREQGEDCAFGGRHPFSDGHGPRGVHHEQDEVCRPLDADLAVIIGGMNREGYSLAFLFALSLEGSRRP
jgi:hypothetical protein